MSQGYVVAQMSGEGHAHPLDQLRRWGPVCSTWVTSTGRWKLVEGGGPRLTPMLRAFAQP